MNSAVSPFRTGAVFVRLRWRRLLHSISRVTSQPTAHLRWAPGAGTPTVSTRQRGSRVSPSVIFALIAVMTGAFFASYAQILSVLEGASPAVPEFAQAVSLTLFLSLVAATCTNLGLAEVIRPEWDLEWLATLPLPRSVLLLSRILERAFVSPALFLGIFPALTLLWLRAGLLWWQAPLAGYLSALPLFLLAALAQTLIDTGLRVRSAGKSAATLRNLQAGATLVGCVAALLVYFQATGVSPVFAALRLALGPLSLFLPTGLLTRALIMEPHGWRGEGLALLVFALECAVLFWVGFRLLMHQLRLGVAGVGQGTAGRPETRLPGEGVGIDRLSWLSPIARRELRLLGRDRNYLAQAVIVPVLVAVMNLCWRTPLSGDGSLVMSGLDAGSFAAVAFFVISYSLMFSSFRILTAEGPALWLLHTLPLGLKDTLLGKARLWTGVAAFYALAATLYSLHAYSGLSSHLLPELVWRSSLILAGIPVFSALAMALGILAFNGASTSGSTSLTQTVRPSFLYLYVTLLAVYAIGIYSGLCWESFVSSLLMALVAYAFWQKAMDELPFLLEPAARPPARISLADGLVATQVFFLLQALSGFLQARYLLLSEGLLIFRSYALAGAGTCLAMLLFYRSRGVSRIPGFRSRRPLREGLLAVGLGACTAAFAVVFLSGLQTHGFFTRELQAAPDAATLGPWYAMVAVLLAPVFEEFIFRGLVFPGLERSLGSKVAILGSALLFAVVHPPVAFVPVFALGALNAWLRKRTGSLYAPALAHSCYNFCLCVVVPFLASKGV